LPLLRIQRTEIHHRARSLVTSAAV
jgi:hypothetical protein